jgi:hypothetical protein
VNNELLQNSIIVNVNVTVENDATIVCTPNCAPVDVGRGDVFVVWNLKTDGYRFLKTDSVVIKNLPDPNFPDPAHYIGPTQVSLKDCCSTVEVFGYTIYVRNTTTKKIIWLDPEIQNQNVSI